MIYQAKLNKDIHHEANTLAEMHNTILNYDYDSLPDFSIALLDDEGEELPFDDRAFLNELRSDHRDRCIEAFHRTRQLRGEV